MIYGTLEHIEQYQGITPGVMKGLRFLAETDFSTYAEGRYEIDSDMYFLIQSYDSKLSNETPEAHRKYIDIQYLISGEELIGVAPLSDMKEEVEAKPDGDIWFYRGPVDYITLRGKRFIALWPEDAHAPSIAVDGKPVPCRKCVVKVRIA